MITYIKGDIFRSNTQAIVNAVNIVGVMEKGLAPQFKEKFPKNFEAYKKACEKKEIDIGRLFVFKEKKNLEEKIIVNFPIKRDWRDYSKYEYIEKGLDNLIEIIVEYDIKSVALPALGCGIGELEWKKVKKIIENKLNFLDINIYVYEPL